MPHGNWDPARPDTWFVCRSNHRKVLGLNMAAPMLHLRGVFEHLHAVREAANNEIWEVIEDLTASHLWRLDSNTLRLC